MCFEEKDKECDRVNEMVNIFEKGCEVEIG